MGGKNIDFHATSKNCQQNEPGFQNSGSSNYESNHNSKLEKEKNKKTKPNSKVTKAFTTRDIKGKAKLDPGNYLMPMNIEKQNKHIIGTKEYKEELGKSIITVNINYLDSYYRENVKNIKIKEDHKAIFKFDKVIGYTINPTTKEKTYTKYVKIHYSTTGYHMVPAIEKE